MNKIGRYSIGKKIGSGGMANVYLAYDGMLGREVAMKVLHPHLAES
jgi:eukaryotic-like serine/threonine-protein kinase